MKIQLVDQNESIIDITGLFNDLANAVSNISGGGGGLLTIDLTVPEAQAARAGALLDRGQLYALANPAQAQGQSTILLLKAIDESTFDTRGTVWFFNGNMGAPRLVDVLYDVDSDAYYRIEDPVKGNICTGTIGISQIPFDDANTNRNYFDNISGIVGLWSVTQFEDNKIENGAVVQCDNSSTCTFNTIGPNAVAVVGQNAACLLSGSLIYGTVILFDTHSISASEICAGYSVDLTSIDAGYTATGKYYGPKGSTFEWITSAIDLNGQTALDLTGTQTSGQDISFVGTVAVTTGGAIPDIDDFATNDSTNNRKYRIILFDDTGCDLQDGTSIMVNGGTPVQLARGGDYIDIIKNPISGKWTEDNHFIRA